MALAFATLCASAQAAEEETHTFDATLSLTGNCSTSAADPVEDPGCPGGAHPPKPFAKAGAATVDLHGDRYVASYGTNFEGKEGRIDVFDPSGHFLAEIAVEAPCHLAVDSQGYLYVSRRLGGAELENNLLRYQPTKYDPAAGEIEYGSAPVSLHAPIQTLLGNNWYGAALAINPANDHLFAVEQSNSWELASAAEGNGFVEWPLYYPDHEQLNEAAASIAIDAVRKRIYVTDFNENPSNPTHKYVVKVFDLEPPANPGEHREVLFSFEPPNGPFTSEPRNVALAVDEATGDVFVGDLGGANKVVYEFDENGALVSTISHSFQLPSIAVDSELAFDNSPTSPTQGYLFVPSGSSPSHSYAFEPIQPVEPPVIESLSFGGVTEDEAVLHGKVNPENIQTSYRFEYTSLADEGFQDASTVGEGTLKPGSQGISLSANLAGLQAGSGYRFRLIAESEAGNDEAEASFTTYDPAPVSGACPNQGLRGGVSAGLPDCRAYELVTPANTNGHPPYAGTPGAGFPTHLTSPTGGALSFQIRGGIIPGLGGAGGVGAFSGDQYLSRRGAEGWQTESAGPNGDFAFAVIPEGSSADQGHAFWLSGSPEGPASIEGEYTTNYVRYPDGHSEVLGQGSLGVEPYVSGLLISEGATHVIFRTGGLPGALTRQLEPDAAPEGTGAIYDRTPDGVTHTISLLPGDVPLQAGQTAFFEGASLDGRGVVFKVANTLYLRRDDASTSLVAEGASFAGIVEGGGRVFFLKGGDLYAFDADSQAVTRYTESGDANLVNVSADGTAAYFVSPQALSVDPNPEGALPQPGGQNLYLSREGALDFVGTLALSDVEGGLGLWNGWSAAGVDPSRSTPEGDVLLFESRARLGAYDNEAHDEVYRYDAAAGTLACLSCDPTGTPPSGEAALQSMDVGEFYLTNWTTVENLRADGKRAFFESPDALVPSDTDGLRDVYEWEEEGVGECQRPGGCVYLISSGSSGRDDYLYAVSDSGDDVFFKTADLLLPAADPDETPSIYDARAGGGFPPPTGPAGECLGEACQPAASAPNDPTPASSAFEGKGNVAAAPPCPAGKRMARKEHRCVPAKRNPHKPKRHGAKRRTHR